MSRKTSNRNNNPNATVLFIPPGMNGVQLQTWLDKNKKRIKPLANVRIEPEEIEN